MANNDDKTPGDPSYALGQLARALSGAGERAATRVRQWRQVIAGILDGSLRIGSRTPVADAPPWVTLEVVHGGFATGGFAAGGRLEPHERKKLASVVRTGKASKRASLNVYYIGDAGRAELIQMLETGCYRIEVPEEAALLTAAWLIEHGQHAQAEHLLDTISPFFDQLRFYPMPHPRPLRGGTDVHVQTVADSVKALRATRPQPAVATMDEAIRVWTPLYDRAVSLFLETVAGGTPTLATDSEGKLKRRADGNPIVVGGWPCRHFPQSWQTRATALLTDYKTKRAKHQLCGKPERPKENFARLRKYMTTCIEDPAALTGRDVGMIRKVLASYVTKHGAPDSERLRATRGAQARNIAKPRHHLIAQVVSERLERLPQDEGAPDLHQELAPLSPDEAASIGAVGGEVIPEALVSKVKRCLEAPLERLIAEKLLSSSEAMARVLPMLTARVRASGIEDETLRRLYESVYMAFRHRRSLLLLNLESQVKLSELPWVSCLTPWIGADEESRRAARETLIRTTRVALEAFPYTILPNKLIKELRALARGADEPLPLVEELASDIFMGAFSGTFLRAAQVAARTVQGTLYQRYYGLPCDRVLALDDVKKQQYGTPSSPGFAAICRELAGATTNKRRSWSVASNGVVIEQSQILTTHNLAVLFHGLELAPSIKDRLPELARDCFRWVCRRQQMVIRDWRAQLQMMKNTAYAWRQMIFFLALANESELSSFIDWATSHLSAQAQAFQERFEPVFAGLRIAASGEELGPSGIHPSGGRRFLGWSVGRHWLLPPRASGA